MPRSPTSESRPPRLRPRTIGCIALALLAAIIATMSVLRFAVRPIELRIAASEGDIERVRDILREGVSVDSRSVMPEIGFDTSEMKRKVYLSGATALFLAAERGHADVVLALLDAGADPRVPGRDDQDAMSAAVEYGVGIELVEALLAAGAYPYPAVSSAMQAADFDVALRLLDAWRDEGHLDTDRKKFIGIARARPDAVGHAIERTLSRSDEPELHRIAREGNAAELRALLDAGADARAKDLLGWTALHWAASSSEAQAKVDALLAAGADANAASRRGLRPLSMAATVERIEVVHRLVDAGAVIDAIDDRRNTALHGAVFWSHGEVVDLLLRAGADATLENWRGTTAAELARDVRSAIEDGRRRGADLTSRF